MGSGNSRIVAWEMGLNYTGFEIDEDYFKVQDQQFKIKTATPLFEQI